MIRSYKGVQPTIPATCYVDASAQIIGDVVLGEHASVWMNAVVRGDVHEIRIGAHSNVQDNSVLHGMKQQWGVYLGEYVTVGHSVTLHGCVIEDRCLIGMGSIILNGAKIGAGSIIAAGTLIPEGTVVEPGSLWMGSPGKFRRANPCPIKNHCPPAPPRKACRSWRGIISPSPPSIPSYGRRYSNIAVRIRSFQTPIWPNWMASLVMLSVRSKFLRRSLRHQTGSYGRALCFLQSMASWR